MGFPAGAPTALDDERVRAALNQLAQKKRESQASDLGDTLFGIDTSDFDAGVILYRQGDPVSRFYLLVSGRVEEVRALDGGETTQSLQIREATAGTALGLYELVGRQPHSTTARTMVPCKMIVIDAGQAYRLFYNDPGLRMAVAPIAIIRRLRTLPLLAAIDGVTISHLADVVQQRVIPAGQTIYQAGDPASTLFLIDQGQVLLEHADGRQLWLGNGAEFGFGDRLPANPGESYELEHNARALCTTTLLSVPNLVFYAITGLRPEQAGGALRRSRTEAVASVGVFNPLTDDERAHLLGFMSHTFMPSRHLLAQQEEVADSLWILLPGQHGLVSALGPHREALPSTRVQGPAYFNFEALFRQTESTGMLEAELGSSWLRLHWTDYRVFLEQSGRQQVAERLAQAQAEQAAMATPPRLYPWQETGERIVHETRRHWVAALTRLMPAFLVTIVTGWLTVAAVLTISGERAIIHIPAVAFLLGVGWVLAFLLYAWGIIDYRNDYLIVTNLRVVLQEKVIFVRESRRVAPLERVQDVYTDRRFWANLLGYADLTVQTPASEGNIRFDRAAHFEAAMAAIKTYGEERRRHFQASGRAEIQAALEKRLGKTLSLPSRVWVRESRPPVTTTPLASPPRLAQWIARLSSGGASAAKSPKAMPGDGGSTGERHVWHKHWFILLRSLLLPLLGLIACMVVAGGVWFTDLLGNFSGSVTFLVLFLGTIALFFVWYQWENWRNDIYILDTDSLIDIERRPLAMKSDELRAQLSQIVDLQLRVPSPLHYLLNFGTVKAQTAAKANEFTFENVPKPSIVIETIRRRMDEIRRQEERRQALQRAQEFPEWLDVYGRLEAQGEAGVRESPL